MPRSIVQALPFCRLVHIASYSRQSFSRNRIASHPYFIYPKPPLRQIKISLLPSAYALCYRDIWSKGIWSDIEQQSLCGKKRQARPQKFAYLLLPYSHALYMGSIWSIFTSSISPISNKTSTIIKSIQHYGIFFIKISKILRC